MKKILVLLFAFLTWSEIFSQINLKAFSSPSSHNIAYGKWSFVKGTNLTDTLFDTDLHNSDDVIRMAGNGANTFWNLWQFSSSAAANRFVLNVGRARGTNTTPSATINGDFIFSLIARAYVANGIGPNVGSFNIVGDATPTSAVAPVAFTWATMNDALNNTTERMRLTSAGRFGLGVVSPQTASIAHLHRNQNSPTMVFLSNNNTGNAAALEYRGGGDSANASVDYFSIQLKGSGFTPSGLLKGKTFLVDGNGSNMIITQLNATEPLQFAMGASRTEVARFITNGNFGLGVTSPTSVLHLKAGTATASTAPLKFTSGTNLTTPEAGTWEYDGTNWYASPLTTRKRLPLSNNVTPSNGQVLIGNGTDYTVASLTAGNGIKITPGSGSITINVDTAFSVSGVYVPSTTTITNLDAVSVSDLGYSVNGTSITLFGEFNVDPTAVGGVEFRFTMPSGWVSAFTATRHAAGTGAADEGGDNPETYRIFADPVTDQLVVKGYSHVNTDHIVSFHLTYRMLFP